MRRAILLVFIVLGLLLPQKPAPVLAADTRPTPEEVVEKSVKAFGPSEVRAPSGGREFDGHVQFRVIVRGAGFLDGTALLQTRGENLHFELEFHNATYPGEDIVYRGEGQPIIRQINPGERTHFGNFLFHNSAIITSGLFGGVLNSAWPLFRYDSLHPKLIWRGTHKEDGRLLYKFEYHGPKQGGRQIFLYFDSVTYQHTMTEYHVSESREIFGGRMLQEKFSDFREISGMNLPSTWAIRWMESDLGGMIQEWRITIASGKLGVDPTAFASKP